MAVLSRPMDVLRGSALPGLVRTTRPRQWVKNVLVLAAPFAGGAIIAGQQDTYRHLRARVAQLLADPGLSSQPSRPRDVDRQFIQLGWNVVRMGPHLFGPYGNTYHSHNTTDRFLDRGAFTILLAQPRSHQPSVSVPAGAAATSPSDTTRYPVAT